MSPTPLRKQLIGTWRLVSYVEKPLDGSEPNYPFGKTPKGLILYTPDGYMSAQLCSVNRPDCASEDRFNASAQELATQAGSYIAYSGPYFVDDDTNSLSHTMCLSLFPNWAGQTQPRTVQIDGDDLRLSTQIPFISGGKQVHSHLHWIRVR